MTRTYRNTDFVGKQSKGYTTYGLTVQLAVLEGPILCRVFARLYRRARHSNRSQSGDTG